MHEVHLHSGRDALLIGIPFIAVLVMAIFRLDTLFWAPSKPAENLQRGGCGMDAAGEPLLVDPDGTPSETPARNRSAR